MERGNAGTRVPRLPALTIAWRQSPLSPLPFNHSRSVAEANWKWWAIPPTAIGALSGIED